MALRCWLIGLMILASGLTNCRGNMDIGVSRHRAEELRDLTDLLATPEPKDPNDFYLLDHCHMTVFSYLYDDNENDYIRVNNSIRLRLDHDRPMETNLQFKCYATIVTVRPGYRLLLHFNKVDISSRFHLYLHERLHIFDGHSKKPLTPTLGLFGNYSNELGAPREMSLPAFASDGPSLFLYFEGIPTYSSFDATVTVFKNSMNGTCGDRNKFFYCNVSRLCIPAELQCDGHMNCGGRDRSDEYQCYRMSDDLNYGQQYLDSENIGIMIGSVVSLLILVVVFIWFAVMCVKRFLMKRDLHRLLQSMAANNPPVAPDPDRIYIPPHADIRAMLSPPPCYSESAPSSRRGPSSRSRLELPPPYWADHHSHDTDRLIPGVLVPLAREHSGDNHDHVDSSSSCPLPAQVFSPQSELPQYSSRDDLPTYAAATATGPGCGDADVGGDNGVREHGDVMMISRRDNGDINRNENIRDAGDIMNRSESIRDNGDIMTHLQQQQDQARIRIHAEIKDESDSVPMQTTTSEIESSAAVPV